MKKTLRILIADDHKLIRNGVKLMLENQNDFKPILFEAENGEEIFSILEKGEIDLVLLDISIPDKGGLLFLKEIKSKYPLIPVLMLTMHNEENIIKEAIKIGASGYLLKSSDTEVLVKAILTILKDGKYFSNEVYQILLADKNNEADSDDSEGFLNKREKQILSMLVKEMTSQCIGESLCLSKRTVEGYRKSIMQKLEVKTTIGLVKYALQNNIE